MEEVILGKGMMDYLRLTSFESIVDMIGRPEPDDKVVRKRMQYRGRYYDGVFIGGGCRRNVLISCSRHLAKKVTQYGGSYQNHYTLRG